MRSVLFSTALLASSIASASTAVDGWYISAFGGYSHLSSNVNRNILGSHLSDVRYRNGYNAGGRLGFQTNPVRYEFEYTYISANPNHFRLTGFDFNSYGGRTSANVLMANLYFDFPEFLETISPFIGGGLGYSFLKLDLNASGPFDAFSFNASKNVFTYQGTVGLTYNFSENYALNAAYRYMSTASVNTFGRSFQVQMGSIGVIYRFDSCSYK
ncbi:outer membrane protein [Legionella saoudiensis]|uniref:outer membrane protein n=1 Tax=Legionella saoudiensis TaxID=1750561 RepID=UPI0007313E76|nr:outer membrane beta-barrel protein [Legionella saoudiensis]